MVFSTFAVVSEQLYEIRNSALAGVLLNFIIPVARRLLSCFDTTRVLQNSIQQSTYELHCFYEKRIEILVACCH